MMGKPIFVTIQEAAQLLSVSSGHVWTMVRSGQLAGVKFGRRWIVDHEAIKKLVADAAARAEKAHPDSAQNAPGERAVLAVLHELRRAIRAVSDDVADCRRALARYEAERGTHENHENERADGRDRAMSVL